MRVIDVDPPAPPEPSYAHRATFVEVHDGDSFWLEVDFGKLTTGVTLSLPLYFRLAGIDAWEIPPGAKSPLDPGYAKGYAAREFTRGCLARAKAIVIQTLKPTATSAETEKYGRVLADVWVDGRLLADLLRQAGMEKQAST